MSTRGNTLWQRGAVICSLLLMFFAPLATRASTYWDELQSRGITFAYVNSTCSDEGTCTLDDIMQVFVNIANFILAIVGSLVLVVVVYGGLLWLTSQGNSEQVEKGKTAMRGSFIGLLIIFGAFTAINFLTGALRGGTAGQQNKCELVSPGAGGKAGTGYACIDVNQIASDDLKNWLCIANLCPGGDNIQCAIKKSTDSSSSSSSSSSSTTAGATGSACAHVTVK